jgi:hypothetical protein
MVSSKNGLVRRRLTSAQRQRLLTRYHHSQLTLKQFATQHGVGLSTPSKWLHLERDAVPAKVKFQEVRLPNPAARWPVEVISPQGWIVRLQTARMFNGCPICCGRCHAECLKELASDVVLGQENKREFPKNSQETEKLAGNRAGIHRSLTLACLRPGIGSCL